MTKRDAVGAIEGATNWPPRLGFELPALGNPPHDGIPALETHVLYRRPATKRKSDMTAAR
jgi:hypothetical protein